ncbi:hypothetical protein FRB97_004640 [Tulasnella sp. 331]|nr:hypothetical protein FRB97_004640 [Tulasnella sp. 331]KAG8889529.1 hypothetical protein FRB98_004003 [Tulasnella sp. 332]
MDYSSSLWDLSATQHGLPQQLAPIDDSDFLTLLSKQLNPHSQQPQPSLLQDVSPPLTEDSASPSPPAPLGRGLNGISSTNSTPITATSIQQQKALNATRNDSAISNDEMHKRKKHQSTPEDDDDDDSDLEGQPQQKNSKGQPVKKLNAKRKSGGADETRQLKRKEQNRAAQRAFRERKEKHVKDLEDQVAALEEKSAGQLQENENLRDLLGRLQNENLMLKQSAFTFNMQRTTGAAAANTTNNNTSTQHTGSRTTPSTLPSPIDSTPKSASSPSSAAGGNESGSNQNQFNNQAYTPLINNNNNSSSSGLPSTAQMNVSPATSLGDMALSFFSPPPPPSMNIQPSPYTTIASNPMYTSYTDFGAWDQFFSSGAFDPSWSSIDNSVPSGSGAATTKANDGTTTTSNQVTSGSDNNVGPPNNNNGTGSGNNAMEDLFSSTGNFSDLIAFSSFSPNATSPLSSFQNNNGNGNGNDRISPSISPVARSTPVAAQSFSSSAFQLASRDTASSSSESRTGLVQPRTSSPCGGAEPDEAPLPCSPHHQSRFSTSGMSIKGSPSGEVTRETSCPNTSQEWAQVIESQPIGTLGGTHDIRPPVASRMEDFAMYSEAKQMKLKEVWNTIKSHPQFEECDMDELCRELSQKVRCDGSVPVMDAHEVRVFYEFIIPMRAAEAAERRQLLRMEHEHLYGVRAQMQGYAPPPRRPAY